MALAYPEVVRIRKQMADALIGKRIAQVSTIDIGKVGSWRYGSIDQAPAVFATRLRNGRITAVDRVANTVLLGTDTGSLLAIGYLSGRVTCHGPGETLPKSSCVQVHFDDDRTLAVVISLWGLIRVLKTEERAAFVTRWYGRAIEPNSAQCTWEGFRDALDRIDDLKLSAKKFLHAFEPGYYLSGLDSGYAIEILHRARIHPKRSLASLTRAEQKACYASTRQVVGEAIEAGGRVSEVDLYGQPGRFLPHVCSARVGQPCLECGTPIAKFSFEGGSCFACTTCQPLPSKGSRP